MSYYVKSLKLTFEQQKSFVTCDEYGYPAQGWQRSRYTVTIKTAFRDLLYKTAMDEYHRRYGDLVRVESIFELVVTKTNIHVRRAKLEDYVVIGENDEEILVF